ncbi:MAG: hypothetical protein IT363_12105 [Methanoregulaceae archaeon]|nr:hypothetical protein [Methanoregulaceae archaeon]
MRFASMMLPGLLLFGCARPHVPPSVVSKPTEPRTAEELVATLEPLEEISDGMVAVNPYLSSLCVGPSPEMVAKAKKQYGPHAMDFIRVSMNPAAAQAFRVKTSYPPGAAVVKQKRTGAVGGMIKREPGYDDLGGDWEYFYAEAGGFLYRGRLDSCRSCHTATRSTDHVFGSWPKGK